MPITRLLKIGKIWSKYNYCLYRHHWDIFVQRFCRQISWWHHCLMWRDVLNWSKNLGSTPSWARRWYLECFVNTGAICGSALCSRPQMAPQCGCFTTLLWRVVLVRPWSLGFEYISLCICRPLGEGAARRWCLCQRSVYVCRQQRRWHGPHHVTRQQKQSVGFLCFCSKFCDYVVSF